MTLAKQRIAIAEACRYVQKIDTGIVWEFITPNGTDCIFDELPNYPNDLNAMHEAETVLRRQGDTIWQCYLDNLCIVTGGNEMDGSYKEVWHMVHATSQQRAEAFLRTINKWENRE